MNFFYLDSDPETCAKNMVDKHVVKMIVEHCQLLSTAQHLNGIEALYKPTHPNHPTSVWVRTSIQNYNLLCQFTHAILKEYTYRYERLHACESILYYCETLKPNLPDIGLTKIALAMPDKYKSDDPIESYRKYYIGDKQHIANWKKREIPHWWKYE